MRRDPRFQNCWCDDSSLGAYLLSYSQRLAAALAGVDVDALETARTLIEGTGTSKRRVFAVGNGGSAAIADHLCCDFTKGTFADGHPVIDTQSLVANTPLYSAIANDFGFEQVFASQIEMIGSEGDVLLAVSSSGNSANIVRAVEAARAKGLRTIGLSGFSGGALRTMADVSLHIDDNNYGIVEDAHQALMHILAQFTACRRDRQA